MENQKSNDIINYLQMIAIAILICWFIYSGILIRVQFDLIESQTNLLNSQQAILDSILGIKHSFKY